MNVTRAVLSLAALLALAGCSTPQPASDSTDLAAIDTVKPMEAGAHVDSVHRSDTVTASTSVPAAATKGATAGATKPPAGSPATPSKRSGDTARSPYIGYDSVTRHPRRIPAMDTSRPQGEEGRAGQGFP